MKKFLFVLGLSAIVLSCSKNTGSEDGSSVINPESCILSAEIENYGNPHIWNSGDVLGIYGNKSGKNVRYVVESVSFGAEGRARIYGAGAEGEVIGYYPYSPEGYDAVENGRQPLFPAQTYEISAEEQLKANTVLVTRAQDGILSFSYECGILHLRVTANVDGPVTSSVIYSAAKALCGNLTMSDEEPSITEAGHEVMISGINLPCTSGSPLDLYFMLPPGTYSDLHVVLNSITQTVTKPVEATLTIEPRNETICTVSDKETIYEGSDIVIIGGKFDD